ncbi:hypothetical protein [Staphylococcus haemolyticus]|uniref:hypothetical protein n=1 Tax=Staphylococcus haemolyticus TaxID=1283 RepID=UPI001E428E67|nr:hypothetical protein [Staphylococcus haemolyticus]MCC3723721.1 hypothetical protein [Staphylococcus haemolyticus]
MIWWMNEIVRPYIFFLDEWFWWITLAVLLVSSGLIGKFFHPKSFDSWEDYFWPVLAITLMTLLFPISSVLILVAAPVVTFILAIAGVGGAIFWAVQNNFWIKKER